MDVADTTTKGALVPLNFTTVAPVKLVPVSVTPVPTPPVRGVKLVIVGAGTAKLVALIPVPRAVITLMGPVAAPAGTLVLIDVVVLETIRAGTPLKVTAVALPILVPVIVTVAPTTPETGVKLEIMGAPMIVNLAVLVPVPLGPMTLMVPVVAPAGTVAVIDVAETTVKEVAGVVLNVTPVAPRKLVPAIVTVAPAAPVVGVKLVTVGAGTVKLVADVPIPKAVVTLIGPVVAPIGTFVLIDVAVLVTIVAATLLKVTAVALPRLVPVIVTVAPPTPETGVKLVIAGAPMIVKLATLVPVPLGPMTLTVPVVAPAGTVAVIDVAEITVKVIAEVELKVTPVAPRKLVPVRVTVTPAAPAVGVKLVTVGAGTVKLVADVPVPTAVVTLMRPVVAPVGTFVLIDVAVLVTIVAAVPLKVTAEALPRLFPDMVTVAPTNPETGVKLVIVGTPMIVKLAVLVPVPLGPVTLMVPVVAPTGTVAVIDVAETTANEVAGYVLNVTPVAPRKFVPVIVTVDPTMLDVGVKLVTDGAGTMKLVADVPVPTAVMMLIVPDEAPVGTVTLIDVAVFVVTTAAMPLMVTTVALPRLVPVIVTVAPTTPETGVKLVIVGAPITVKLAALAPVPLGPMILMVPVVAPAGIVAVIEVGETTVKEVAGVVLNITPVAPRKLVPAMVTVAPTMPEVGVKLVTVGAGTVKLVAEVPVPTAVVTTKGPIVAPTGTVVLIDVVVFVAIVAATPLNVTAVALPKFVPVIVTVVPTTPDTGEKLVIVGGPITVKLALLIPVPLGPVTLILPEDAPTGTVAVIDVAEITVNEVAGVVLKFTVVAPRKLVPVIITAVPTIPDVGVKPVTVGTGTVKLVADVAVPATVVTRSGPVVAPIGTFALIAVAVLVMTVPAMPLKVTDIALPRLVPMIVTVVPTTPETGVMLVIVGSPITVTV